MVGKVPDNASHFQIREGLLLESYYGGRQPVGKVYPSEGVYYVVPMPTGWVVMACRYADVAKEIDHSEFWKRHVCRRLAGTWAVKLAHPFDKLVKRLEEHPYAFPRGRVAKVDNRYHLYHGSDLPNALGIKRRTIEAIFGVKGKGKWIEDDHERCLEADKMAVRKVLALEEDWAAV